MVSTRSQNKGEAKASGRASSAIKAASESIGATEDVLEDDGEYEARKKGKSRKSGQTPAPKPAAKRQKTAKASTSKAHDVKAPPTKTRRRGKDLSLLPTMPLDILYEILGELSPKDLLSLGRTNKLWRKTVLAKNMGFLWKAAREAFDAPEPPEDFSEPRWASLLFEESCQTCGSNRGITDVDWLLLRRACTGCKKAHLVCARRLHVRLPNIDKAILDYVPHTYTSGYVIGWRRFSKYLTSGTRYYWCDEVEQISAERKGIRGASKVRQWEEDKSEAIRKRSTMALVYGKWQKDMNEVKASDAASNRKRRLKAVISRFMEAGFEKVDIEDALTTRTEGIYRGTPDVSNAAWTKLRPKLEPMVQESKNVRVAKELKPEVDKRMEILEEVYNDYLDTLRPIERCYCPPVDVFRPFPEVIQIVEADKDVVITAQDFQPIASQFGRYISDYQRKTKEHLVGLQAQNPVHYPAPKYQTSNSGDTVLIGWDMIGGNDCPDRDQQLLRPGVYIDMPSNFGFNYHTSEIATKLIMMAGMDPTTTTVAEMDERDRRFVQMAYVTEVGYQVFTWRGALIWANRFRFDSYGLSLLGRFRVATTEEEAEAKENEGTLHGDVKAWSCNHCHDFIEASEAETKGTILEHLQSSHGMTEPKAPNDYFFNERCRHIYEEPYEIASDIPKYRCLCYVCTWDLTWDSGEGRRLFTAEGIQEHMEARRKPNPIEGTDYERVVARGPPSDSE